MKLALLILFASALAGETNAQDFEQRAKTVERLQQAGINLGTLPVCTLAGYEVDTDWIERYSREEMAAAASAGLYDVQAQAYIETAQRGEARRNEAVFNRVRKLAEAGDKSSVKIMSDFIDEAVEKCDLLAIRSETSPLFSYTPLNTTVARQKFRSAMGLNGRNK